MDTPSYGMLKTLPEVSYEDAITRVTEALQAEGFGVLTEIDVRATLKKKLDAEFRPYVILGACNPHLAHRALQTDGQIGLLMPCNVVVQAAERGCVVSIMDPGLMAQFSDEAELDAVAGEARARLDRVLAAL